MDETGTKSPEPIAIAERIAKASRRIPTLDGWRAIAILGVLMVHSAGFLLPQNPPVHTLLYQVMEAGALGVSIFFGISGFLICSRLIDEEKRVGAISLRGFYIRRSFRILPLYFGYLFTIALLSLLVPVAVTKHELLATGLFVQNYALAKTEIGWFTGHFWSLTIEEHFYLLLPSLLLLTSRNARARLYALLALSLLIAAWRTVEFRAHILERVLPGISFYPRTDVSLDKLFLGAALAAALAIQNWKSLLVRIFSNPWAIPISLSAFLLIAATEFPQRLLAQAILIPLMIFSTVARPHSGFSKLLEARPLQWIGRLSFSLYVWNNLFLVPSNIAKIPGLSILQTFPWNFPMLFLTATASYYLIEQPLIRLGHYLSKDKLEDRNNKVLHTITKHKAQKERII